LFFASFQNGSDPLLLVPSSNTFFDGQDGETPNGQAVNSMGLSVMEISFFSGGHSFGVFFAQKIDIHTIRINLPLFFCA